MRSWRIMLGATLLLAFPFYVTPAIKHAAWVVDGCIALEQAENALEFCGVEGEIADSAPTGNRDAVAGHIRTEGGTLPFFVRFAGQGTDRLPVKVTVGSKTLIPPPVE